MIKLPNMLMIGSTGRNVGKTELACTIIEQHSKHRSIVGLKVTTVKDRNGACPRGGAGCGVCSSLEGEYCIEEEKTVTSDKDTSRLLAAGASRVYWLRVMKDHLEEGIAAALALIDEGSAIVCESNSLRLVVEPGLFLMVTLDSTKPKESAADVLDFADIIIHSVDDRLGLDADRIAFNDGRWILHTGASAIILAGGKSSRMGMDKRSLAVGDTTMLQHVAGRIAPYFERILLSANDDCSSVVPGIQHVPDILDDAGPFSGIASALNLTQTDLNFVTACDIPEPDIHLMMRMLDLAVEYDIVVPRMPDGHIEPLFAVYRKSILPGVLELLQSGERRIRAVYDQYRTLYLDIPETASIKNVNTPRDYDEYRAAVQEEEL